MERKSDVTLGLPVLYFQRIDRGDPGESVYFPGLGLYRTDARLMVRDLGLRRRLKQRACLDVRPHRPKR